MEDQITMLQAILCAVQIHETGETWAYSFRKALDFRETFNRALAAGFTKDELLTLLDKAEREKTRNDN